MTVKHDVLWVSKVFELVFSPKPNLWKMTLQYLPWQCAAAEGHHVVIVAKRTGWSYHLHLSAGSLQVGQRWLSVGGTSCQHGLWSVGGQSVGRGPCDDGLWLAGSQGVVTCKWITGRGQTAIVKL